MLPSDGITAGILGEFLEAENFPAMSPEVTWSIESDLNHRLHKRVSKSQESVKHE